MYAGISSVSAPDCDNFSEIPEWKKILIMKKRAGSYPSADEHSRRNPDSNVNIVRNGLCESNGVAGGGKSTKVAEQDAPPKKVTIGNINVKLRSAKPVEVPNCFTEEINSNCEVDGTDRIPEDLRYGPGIVDRLRARFLNIGVKQQVKPVVRRFSSLENLPGDQIGPYRVNARGGRQNGFKPGYGHCPVKKALSMETLSCNVSEQHIFAASRRPNTRVVVGVKARILSRNVTPISVITDETDKTPSPSVSPRLFNKSIRRYEYGRSVSITNINTDELPKPDTVKHVKKIFEAPTPANCNSEKTTVSSAIPRFRQIPSTTTPVSHAVCNNSAIVGSTARPVVKKTSEDAKATCAKDVPKVNNAVSPSTPDSEEEKYDDFVINEIADNDLSANRSCEAQVSQDSLPASDLLEENDCESYSSDLESPNKVTPERLPLELSHKHSDALSLEEKEPCLLTGGQKSEEEMVVASSASGRESATDSFPQKKGSAWQKPPQSSTSIVFDFRGRKDVEPHISLNPAPFGCRPAKVSRNTCPKRSGSPPRSPVNGIDIGKEFVVEDVRRDHEDEEDWDEMDIGADLPVISGIVFTGENVKVGRGSLLETRNKKLSIQFDDEATSTFEYPSENTSLSPREENGCWSDSFDSSTAMGSTANSRLGLSNYTPQVLGTSDEFELGVSKSNHRPTVVKSSEKNEIKEDIPITDVLIPANPEDTVAWSSTETADILF